MSNKVIKGSPSLEYKFAIWAWLTSDIYNLVLDDA